MISDQDLNDNQVNNDNVLFKPNLSLMGIETDDIINKTSQNQFQRPMDMIMNNTKSIMNRSSFMTYGKVVCCICSIQIEANPTGMCSACSKTQVNIADGIVTHATVLYCKGCDRYERPPWTHLAQESNEMMTFLLSKLKGLKGIKLIDSNFIWQEPHSKKKKIKITIQKESNNVLLQTSLICEFVEEWTQCAECKKTFTPHLWNASCQIRQKVDHKRTFLYFEQAILKHKMHEKALNIKETPEGVDFYFKSKSHAASFSNFARSVLPIKIKESKRLISFDQYSNVHHYKYSYMLDVARVCKDDIIVLSREERKELGGIGPILLCYKTSSNVHLMDPRTFEVLEFNENTFWKYNFKSYVDRSTLEEFTIQSVDDEIDYKEKYQHMSVNSVNVTANDIDMDSSKLNISTSTQLTKNSRKTLINKNTGNKKNYFNKRENHKFNIVTVHCTKLKKTHDGEQKLYQFRCHLGDKLRPGDTFFGYDIAAINLQVDDEYNESIFPEIVLVKKKFVRSNKKRLWKLQRLQMADKKGDLITNDEANDNDEEDGKKGKKKGKGKKEEDKKVGTKKGGIDMDDAAQFEDFLRDVEEDKDLRKNVDLHKDDDVMRELTEKLDSLQVKEIIKKNDEDFGIGVEDLMSGLKISCDDEDIREEFVDTSKGKKIDSLKTFKEPLPIIHEINEKSNMGQSQLKQKRTRTGSDINSSDNHDEKDKQLKDVNLNN
jgi:nonsense-mediated mRNA decay protein 3